MESLVLRNPPERPFVFQGTFPSKTPGLTIAGADTRVVARTLREGWIIYEVCKLVAAGTRELPLLQGPPAQGSGPDMRRLVRLALSPGYVQLELTDAAGSQRFDLTGVGRRGFERVGTCYVQSYHHVALGRFGWCHYWIAAREGTDQLDFCLNLHNGVPGPDRRFTSARIITSAPFRPALPDPAMVQGWLVAPGEQLLPQQFNRLFRFSVGSTSVPEYVGVGDWSRGGFLPAAFSVPSLSGVDHGPALAEARNALEHLLPDPSYAHAPVSALWPARGSPAPSEGGGVDRLPLLGVRWAATGDPAALELYRINQLRDWCRARRRYDPDGRPIRLASPKTWDFYDGFLRGKDAPWEWDRWPPTTPPIPDPRVFADYGMETHVRGANDNWALAWLANDAPAKLAIRESATRARLHAWDDTIQPANPAHLGTSRSSDFGQCALAIAADACLGRDHAAWAAHYSEHLRTSQMPSGCLQAVAGAYPSDRPPFFDRYLLSGSEAFAVLVLAAYSLGNADDVVRKAAAGTLHLATDDDDSGLYYFFPTGPRDGTSTRYVTDDDWPADLRAAMGEAGPADASYYTAWNMGLLVSTARGVGASEYAELLQRFTQGTDPHTWGLVAQSQTDAPVEQWYPIL